MSRFWYECPNHLRAAEYPFSGARQLFYSLHVPVANTTITKHNMRINILKPSGLAKSQLEVDKTILNSI
jgi:hypothetical protein